MDKVSIAPGPCVPAVAANGKHVVEAFVTEFVTTLDPQAPARAFTVRARVAGCGTLSPSGSLTVCGHGAPQEYRLRISCRALNQSFCIYRRFSAFYDLYNQLHALGATLDAPFPSRSLFTVVDKKTLEYRRLLVRRRRCGGRSRVVCGESARINIVSCARRRVCTPPSLSSLSTQFNEVVQEIVTSDDLLALHPVHQFLELGRLNGVYACERVPATQRCS